MMKQEKKNNSLIKFLKSIYSFFDKVLITPISKVVYLIREKFGIKTGVIDKILNKPTVLLYVSLIIAFVSFILINNETLSLSDTRSIVINNVEVTSLYNEEAYVIEGLPEKAEISLRGRTGELYLAKQLGDHRVSIDLSNLGVGTHKVNLEYNNPVKNLKYTLSPSTATIVIYPKISEVRTLQVDVINTDKLDETLVVTNVLLDRDEVIIKSYKEKIDSIANVKAIVDVNSLNASTSGTYTLENVKLVAYDQNGREVTDIEIVPNVTTATVTITSPSKTVPLKVVPTGDVRSGSAISSISSTVNNGTIYADESILNEINFIEVEVDVTNLSETKVYQKVINKPVGARSISDTSVTITVSMEEETSKDFENITVVTEGLDEKFKATAASANDAAVTVTVKGVASLLNDIDPKTIKAYVDLSNINETGSFTVPVFVTGEDVKFTYTSKVKNIQVLVTNN